MRRARRRHPHATEKELVQKLASEATTRAGGVALRTLQEWMGHRDLATTQIYADYAPSAQEAALVEAAFGGPQAVESPVV